MHQNSKFLQTHDGVSIHAVSTILSQNFPTILYLPGLSSEATEGYKHLVPLLEKDINVASMSFRGRGRSSTPKSGYTLKNHASDLDAVIKDLGAKKLTLIATSVSAIYAVKYLIEYGIDSVSKLIIVDHPLKVRKLKEGWAEEFSKISVNGISVTSTMRRSALDAIERESEDVNLYPQFRELKMATLVMYPTIPKGVIQGSDLSVYDSMDQVELVEFRDSDHLIRLRELEKYLLTLERFVCSPKESLK